MLLSTSGMWRVIFLSFTIVHVAECGYGHFDGGSISFSVHQNGSRFFADLDVLTGWVLRRGPCGTSCNKSDIGSLTNFRRHQVEVDQSNIRYFGNWTAEYKNKIGHKTETRTADLNYVIDRYMTETVIAMNTKAEWEQELMKVTVELEPTNSDHFEDIYFEGESWHPFTMQPTDMRWHIQAKIDRRIRNDTGMPNRSPVVFMKPFYRVRLNKESRIHIAATDPDGDLVKCSMSEYSESAGLSRNPLPGVNVTEDCTVTIDASAAKYGYTDDSWGAVGLTLRDYTKTDILLGNKKFPTYQFSLSGTAAQFLIQVLEHLNAPVFVPPTPEANHHFILYAGTVWRQTFHARSNVNTSIAEFTVIGRQQEIFFQTPPIEGDEPHVKYTKIKWVPQDTDVGNHIICVTAVDDTGVDTDEDRCYIIEIRPDRFHHSPGAISDRPYFVDVPAPEQIIECDIDVTCVVPLYVISNTNIKAIQYTSSFDTQTTIGPITVIVHKGQIVYESDLSFRKSVDIVNKICLIAIDVKGVQSDEACIQTELLPPDPCISNPCSNGATCRRSEKDPAVYICICLSGFEGYNCDIRDVMCDESTCKNGATCYPQLPNDYFCYCLPDYISHRCDLRKNLCSASTCNGHGICVFGKCTCFDRYDGASCSKDLCPLASGPNTCDDLTCPIGHCSGHGVCTTGGECVCSLGYKGDSRCSTASGDVARSQNIAGIKFVPPSPPMASVMRCYLQTPCRFSVFIATRDGAPPTITMDRAEEDIQNSVISAVSEVSYIHGLDNLYTAEVTVTGATEANTMHLCLAAEAQNSLRSRLCLEIQYSVDPSVVAGSHEAYQKNANYKFIDPTPNGDSKFVCGRDEECSIVLHTNSRSGQCENVISAGKDVYVMPTIAQRSSCITEVIYRFAVDGTKQLCFSASALALSQTRCFYIDVYNTSSDLCAAQPCKRGDCYHKGRTSFYCVCSTGYTGDFCEKGACDQRDNNCDGSAFCYADNHNKQCICPIGMTGPLCRERTAKTVVESQFTDTAVPVKVTCVLARMCTIPLGVSSKDPQKASLGFGYVSPHIRTQGISVETVTAAPNTRRATVYIFPLEVGEKIVCVQTFVDRTNQDELCITVDVTSDFSSIYGYVDRPYFIAPSLPTNTEVKCPADEPCHVLYHVTPGKGHEKDCAVVLFTQLPFQNGHVFSSCSNCQPGYGSTNCTVDVSFLPTSAHLNQTETVCVEAELSTTHLKGEKRCFNVTTLVKATFQDKSGCQILKCDNGGFCDSHYAQGPRCICTPGFIGTNCDTPISGHGSTVSSGQANFDKNVAWLKHVECELGLHCDISVGYIGPILQPPVIGYIDSGLNGVEPMTTLANLTKHGMNETFNIASMSVTASTKGNHTVCLHTTDNGQNTGQVTDQLCFTVNVIAQGSVYTTVDLTHPRFSVFSYPNGSTLSCLNGSACSLWVATAPTRQGTCTTIGACHPTISGLQIHQATMMTGTCITEMEFTVSTTNTNLCVSSGSNGEQRMYTIVLRDNTGGIVDLAHSSASLGLAKPSFLDSTNVQKTILCDRGSSCTVPLLVRSSAPLSAVDITYSGHAQATVGRSTLLDHTNGYLYSATLNVRLNTSGIYHICLVARDNRDLLSDEKCIETEMVHPDPCKSSPCQNSGTCVRGAKNPEDYVCICQSERYLGKNCETMRSPCQPNPCVHGTCQVSNMYASCKCDPGYIGELCDHAVSNCHVERCVYGVCQDFVLSSHCACYPGYTGLRCESRSP